MRSKRSLLARSWASPGLLPADPVLAEHLAGGHEVGSLDECSACVYQRPLIERTIATVRAIIAPPVVIPEPAQEAPAPPTDEHLHRLAGSARRVIVRLATITARDPDPADEGDGLDEDRLLEDEQFGTGYDPYDTDEPGEWWG